MPAPHPLHLRATITSEGGPILIATPRSALAWPGAAPLPPSQQTTLHYWGQFTPELPPPYARDDGGHVYIHCETPQALDTETDRFIATILAAFPGATEASGAYQSDRAIQLPDGRRTFFDRYPASRYEQACDASAGRSVWPLTDPPAFLFDIDGPGTADIYTSDSSDELLAVRSFTSDPADDERILTFLRTPPRAEAPAHPDPVLTLDEDHVVFLWSPCTTRDLPGIHAHDDLVRGASPATPRILDEDGIEGVGAVLAVPSGTYTVSSGTHDATAWFTTWLRLRRT